MLKSIDPTKTIAWNKLNQHFEKMKNTHMRHLFVADPQRYENFSIQFEDKIHLDFSKNILNEETIKLLIMLAQECFLPESISQMFLGKKINKTENRPVLHTALRNQSQKSVLVDNVNIMPDVNRVLMQIRDFSTRLISGDMKGFTGKPLKDIVNIGIGGSDLGPFMVCEALRPYHVQHLNLHFISNVDGTHISETLKKLNPETTLFLIASKTFTTQETMTNAETAKKWFLQSAENQNHVAKHFVAMSANVKAVEKFGITENNRFEFWEWVGGRFSLCSAVGLSIACSIGYDNFEKLLQGAHEMDLHFANTPFEKNLPVMLALISIWYVNFFSADTEAIFPYDQNLHRFVPYIQQCNMESNGKSVDRNGQNINYQTGPIIWGETGTNGQHAFFQLLHQGTKFIPCDFLVAVNSHTQLAEHHKKLLANFFAQTEALAFGNMNEQINKREPFKLFRGNHPSNSIVYKSLTPYTLGALIAMYEHKVFTQGVVWNIFSFDQWGVELGKKLAEKILPELDKHEKPAQHDSSTNGLINLYKKWQN